MKYSLIPALFLVLASGKLLAQQHEQNRDKGLPSGGAASGDQTGAQDFKQRAYADYYATLQVRRPSPSNGQPWMSWNSIS